VEAEAVRDVDGDVDAHGAKLVARGPMSRADDDEKVGMGRREPRDRRLQCSRTSSSGGGNRTQVRDEERRMRTDRRPTSTRRA